MLDRNPMAQVNWRQFGISCVQLKVMEEIESEAPPSFENLKNMSYLTMVVQETLR
jgi:hypothetical protein